MKTIVSCLVTLVIGVIIGWSFEGNRAKRDKESLVEEMLLSVESADTMHVAYDAKAIGLIASGNIVDAVETLSHPIAHYYQLYQGHITDNQTRLKLRTAIEELMRTNLVVDRSIKERMDSGKKGT
jgi:hypothetical protein